MIGANSRTMNNYAVSRNSDADVRADETIAQRKHADLAQWQSSGFVNSAGLDPAQGQEHSQIRRGQAANPSPEQSEQLGRLRLRAIGAGPLSGGTR